METSFGADFSGVRVHTDAGANQLNERIQAKAFTTGSDIFFRSSEYDPSSSEGQHLLAHELTHVVQQGATSVQRSPEIVQRDVWEDRLKDKYGAKEAAKYGAGSDDVRNAALAADQGIAQEAQKYLRDAGDTGDELARILTTAGEVSLNKALVLAGIAKIGAGVANIATGGLSFAASMGVAGGSIAAGAAERNVRNRSKREVQGREQQSAGGVAGKAAKNVGKEALTGAVAMGGKALVVMAAEVTASAIPIVGGLAQIALGIRSISKAMDHAMAQGLMNQAGDIMYFMNAVEGNRDALAGLAGQAQGSETKALLQSAAMEMGRLAAELDALNRRISKVAGSGLRSTRGRSRAVTSREG